MCETGSCSIEGGVVEWKSKLGALDRLFCWYGFCFCAIPVPVHLEGLRCDLNVPTCGCMSTVKWCIIVITNIVCSGTAAGSDKKR